MKKTYLIGLLLCTPILLTIKIASYSTVGAQALSPACLNGTCSACPTNWRGDAPAYCYCNGVNTTAPGFNSACPCAQVSGGHIQNSCGNYSGASSPPAGTNQCSDSCSTGYDKCVQPHTIGGGYYFSCNPSTDITPGPQPTQPPFVEPSDWQCRGQGIELTIRASTVDVCRNAASSCAYVASSCGVSCQSLDEDHPYKCFVNNSFAYMANHSNYLFSCAMFPCEGYVPPVIGPGFPPGITGTPPVPPGQIPLDAIPLPYVPCNQTRDPEFHSLRPYQASPCDTRVRQVALFCGNDLVLATDETVTYPTAGLPACSNWNNPGETNCCNPATMNDGDDQVECKTAVNRNETAAIDLSGASLPIMGNTELGTNSQNRADDDTTFPDSTKVNEYVSWYLNGVTGRAEYDFLDSEDPNDISKVVNFSGPIKKLLPLNTQNRLRRNQSVNAYRSLSPRNQEIRHNQIVGCLWGLAFNIPLINYRVDLGGIPASCYDDNWLALLDFFGLKPNVRLAEWREQHKFPPFEEDYAPPQDVQDYLVDYQEWRGMFCVPVTINFAVLGLPILGTQTFHLCFDNPFNANFWSNIYTYIPFSSTEDRLGSVEISPSGNQTPANSNYRIISAAITVGEPAILYFAHMQEDNELARILQQSYAAKDLPLSELLDSGYITPNQNCDIRQIRTNPGDDLFAGEITASVAYSAEVYGTFYDGTGNQGHFCQNIGGDCRSGANLYCGQYYGNLDCPGTEFCCGNPGSPLTDSGNCPASGGNCVPNNYTCATTILPNTCSPSGQYSCGIGCTRPISSPGAQTETHPVYVRLRVITKSPLATTIWARLVAGTQSVFGRFFPKIGPGAPVTTLLDIPTSTNVVYTSTNPDVTVRAGSPGSGRSGANAELYFPHIGGIKEYFLTGIQTLLRPKGYGNQLLSGPNTGGVPPAPSNCALGVGLCAPDALLPYWNNDINLATQASIVCQGESSSNPLAANTNCLTGTTCDYSIGLYQINLLAHCAGTSGFNFSCDAPIYCTVINQSLVNSCRTQLEDPVANILRAKSLYDQVGWAPWTYTATRCGFLR